MVRDGKTNPDEASDSHPPSRLRAEQLVESFHRIFEVEFQPDSRGCHVTLNLDPSRSIQVEERVKEHIHSGAYEFAQVLFAIWKEAREKLMRDYTSKRSFHPMWA